MKKLKTPYKRKPMFPEAEEHLYAEFCEHRKVGDKVSGLWLRARMEQLAKEHATTPTKKHWHYHSKLPIHGSLDSQGITKCHTAKRQTRNHNQQ